MREIKFRAWNIKEKKLYEWYTILKAKGTSAYFWVGVQTDDNILMQYTGLKDKNGKEIYEGDIVKTEYQCCDDYGNTLPDIENDIIEIKWEVCENRQFCGMSFFPCMNKNSIEIIGNIYENPELLK